MASSSKNISMPLVFAISVGSIFALVASVVFALAWYEYQARVTIREQVLTEQTHPADYLSRDDAQQTMLDEQGTTQVTLAGTPTKIKTAMPIDQAMQQIVAEQTGAE